MDMDAIVKPLILAVVFSIVGMLVFFAGFFVIRKMLPFDVHKELEVDQNTAVGIVIASFILGLAFIVGMAIHGG
jgi:putative membrane protein